MKLILADWVDDLNLLILALGKIILKFSDEEFIRAISYEDLKDEDDPDSFEHYGCNRAGLLHNGKRAERQKWGKNGKNVENLPRSKTGKNGEKIPKKWKIGLIFHFFGIFRPFFPHFRSGQIFHVFPFFSHFCRSARFPLCSRPARLQHYGYILAVPPELEKILRDSVGPEKYQRLVSLSLSTDNPEKVDWIRLQLFSIPMHTCVG